MITLKLFSAPPSQNQETVQQKICTEGLGDLLRQLAYFSQLLIKSYENQIPKELTPTFEQLTILHNSLASDMKLPDSMVRSMQRDIEARLSDQAIFDKHTPMYRG